MSPVHTLRQKKVTKEKATPLRASLRFAAGNLRCSLQAGSAQTRFAQTRAALHPPEAALLGTRRGEVGRAIAALGRQRPCCARPGTAHAYAHVRVRVHAREDVHVLVRVCSVSADLQQSRSHTPHKDAPWRVEVQLPSGRSRACLSEASLRGPREKRAPQASRSEAQGCGQWGRLFFGYFLLAKQKKVTRLPGRHPGSGLGTGATLKQAPGAPTPVLPRRGREQVSQAHEVTSLGEAIQ